MFKDEISATGKLDIYVYDGDELVEHRQVKNLVVTSGKQHIAARMGPTPPAAMSNMALGGTISPTPPLLTDVALNTELGRVALSGTTVNGKDIQYTATFPAGTATSANITEAGIFNASSAGTMLARTTFAAFNKTATTAIVVVWTVTLS